MAITLVGTAEGSAIDGADVTITLPSLLQDDVVYVGGGHANKGTNAGVSTDGYTELVDVSHSATNPSPRYSVSRKVMGATPDTSVVCKGGAGAPNACAYVVIALRGVDTTTPEDATATTAEGSSTNPNPPSITTATANAWVLPFAGGKVNDTTVTAPSGYSNQVDINGNDDTPFTTGGATKEIASPGAEDPATWTTWANGQWLTVTVAVRPAAVAGQPTMRRWGGVPGMLGAGRPGSGRSWCSVPDLSWIKGLLTPAEPAWLRNLTKHKGAKRCRAISFSSTQARRQRSAPVS